MNIDSTSTDSKFRFTDRVADYSLYRPGYTSETIDYILKKTGLGANTVCADVGAGTGLFTELLLARHATVVAVEPNSAMRMEADKRLGHLDTYSSVGGAAESTGLADNSVEIISVAQAFHWFDLAKTRKEFTRILKPGGNIILVWNRRDSTASEFLLQYEALLKSMVPEYNQVSHSRSSDAVIEDFLGPGMVKADFENYQDFDLQGLKGRLLSSSYTPAKGKKGHAELMEAIDNLYQIHASDSGVRFHYRAQVYHV